MRDGASIDASVELFEVACVDGPPLCLKSHFACVSQVLCEWTAGIAIPAMLPPLMPPFGRATLHLLLSRMPHWRVPIHARGFLHEPPCPHHGPVMPIGSLVPRCACISSDTRGCVWSHRGFHTPFSPASVIWGQGRRLKEPVTIIPSTCGDEGTSPLHEAPHAQVAAGLGPVPASVWERGHIPRASGTRYISWALGCILRVRVNER